MQQTAQASGRYSIRVDKSGGETKIFEKNEAHGVSGFGAGSEKNLDSKLDSIESHVSKIKHDFKNIEYLDFEHEKLKRDLGAVRAQTDRLQNLEQRTANVNVRVDHIESKVNSMDEKLDMIIGLIQRG